MPIIPLLSKSSFDPETIEILAAAFDKAWQRLAASGSPIAKDETAAREMLAKNIITAARTGLRDKDILIERALAGLNSERDADVARVKGGRPSA
jgi:hypothetical protein